MSVLVALVATIVAPLADPAAEHRAQALEREIRCVACENEPISQSTADIAEDMRRVVRERVTAGESDDQIRAYFRQRYGDFVLLRPPVDRATWALWAAPVALLVAAALAGAATLRRRDMPPEPEEGER